MATHSSILTWRIPWTEEPGGLYSSWGRKESDVTEVTEHTHTHTHTHTHPMLNLTEERSFLYIFTHLAFPGWLLS